MFNMSFEIGPEGKHDHVEIDVVARYINPRLSEQAITVVKTQLLLNSPHLAQFLPHMVKQTDYAFDLELGDANGSYS